MSKKYEDMIKDLSPELQEKVKESKNFDELSKFLADNDIEMPDEVLELVSGGGCGGCSHDKRTQLEIKPPYFRGEFAWIKRQCDKCGAILYYCRWNDYALERELTKEQYDVMYNPYKH